MLLFRRMIMILCYLLFVSSAFALSAQQSEQRRNDDRILVRLAAEYEDLETLRTPENKIKSLERQLDTLINQLNSRDYDADDIVEDALKLKQRIAQRIKLGVIYESLNRMQLCSACSSKIAEAYIKHPKSNIVKLVDNALAGDQTSVTLLQEISDSSLPIDPNLNLPENDGPKITNYLLILMLTISPLAAILASKSIRSRVKRHKALVVIFSTSLIASMTVALTSGGNIDPRDAACAQDWQRCTDNTQLIEYYNKHFDAVFACKQEARKRARYGKPEFSRVAFGSYYPGDDYIRTGIMQLIENNAKFQNVYGTVVNTRVYCDYNLYTNAVVSIHIEDF